jgi:hypothetical protein
VGWMQWTKRAKKATTPHKKVEMVYMFTLFYWETGGSSSVLWCCYDRQQLHCERNSYLRSSWRNNYGSWTSS